MRKVIRVVLPLVIVTATYFGVRFLIGTAEEPGGFTPPPSVTRVEAVTLKTESYQAQILSQGIVEPRTQSTLIPQVSGKIVELSPALREGGFFNEGDVLLRIDPLDYETAVVVAERNVAQAEALIEQEKARAVQAEENWKRLGKKGRPGALARREPQLAEARAQVAAAKAELARAERDLERTVIRAPYSGQTLNKSVDIGQVVSNGTMLGEIYADDYVEVRLPIRNEDLAFINLPEAYRGEVSADSNHRPAVTLTANLGGKEARWEGYIVRVAGALDSRSKQLFVVAHVDDPYAKRPDGTPPLRIGLFVKAKIQGNRLDDVFVLPSNAVRANNEVVLIDDESRMQRRIVTPLLEAAPIMVPGTDEVASPGQVIVASRNGGLTQGERLCLTQIAYPANGAQVVATIDGVAPPEPKRGPPGSGGPGKPGS